MIPLLSRRDQAEALVKAWMLKTVTALNLMMFIALKWLML